MEISQPKTNLKKPGCLTGLASVLMFLAGGYCIFFYPLIQYDFTVVNWRIPVISGCVVGFIVAIAFARKAGIFVVYFLITAFALNAVFFFLNTTFSNGKMQEFKLAIMAKYPRYLKTGPYAVVKFRNKQLSINAASDEELKEVSYGVLTVDKGLFGYYIIRAYRLQKYD